MDNETLFYVCGVVLAASAVIITFVGLRIESFPGRVAPLIAIWFALFVGGVGTFSVLHAQDEHEHEAAELSHASAEAEGIEQGSFEDEQRSAAQGGNDAAGVGSAAGGGEKKAAGGEKAGGETLKLAADPTQIAFDTTSLSSRAGELTIDFDNPAAVEHNVAIEKDGEVLAESETITEGETSVTADLDPGTYTFVCTVPGHEEAGMKGTLTVK